LKRKHIRVPAPALVEQSSCPTPASSCEGSQAPLGRVSQQHKDGQSLDQRQNLWEQTHRLHGQAYGIRAIAKLLGLARNTVRRYLKMEEGWHTAPRPKRRSLIDPYRDYLLSRWMQGEHNGNQLTREIHAQGYHGCATLAREVITTLRKTYPEVTAFPRTRPTSMPSPPPTPLASKVSPRQIRWLLAKRQEDLDEQEQEKLSRLLETSEEIRLVHQLLQRFLTMLRERQADHLNAWMQEARASKIKELHSFVVGIERDYDAVSAGLSLAWSQGPVEGTVNKLKVHKRLMYGRAGFPLFRQKMLHCMNFRGSHQKRP
jgi:transposase